MPTDRPKAATREQVARYGHIAAALRAVLKQRGWKVADLNEAIGRERNYTPSHVWLAAKGAPNLMMRALIAKATGIPETELMPLRRGEARPVTTVTTATPLALPGPAAAPAPRPVLVFNVLEDGGVELELRKIRLPLDEGSALLRMLLDAGVVLRKTQPP
jgi:transcriptional regulator with XRE-family HTH domain